MKRSVYIIAAMALLAGRMVAAQDYETPSDLSASAVLSEELLSGDGFAVDERVVNDGYLNYYRISSDYGEFEAVGIKMLRKRIGEIGALRALDELSKTSVFIKAAADAGLRQVRQISAFAARPIATITGVPAGIGRMFTRYRSDAGEAVAASQEFVAGLSNSDGEDSSGAQEEGEGTTEKVVGLTENYMGVSRAGRNWARKLGTDPYSDNQLLQEAIREFAWAERLGSMGMSFAGVPKIPGANVIADVNEAVWSKDPYELADLNRTRLESTGADGDLIEAYLDSPVLTPTQKSVLTAALAEMEPIEGREGVLVQALNVRTPVEANYLVDSVAMLAWYHLNQKSLTAIRTYSATPIGVIDDASAALLFAADHVYWTESIAEAAASHARELEPGQAAEFWLLGTASERTRAELAKMGFELRENTNRLLVSTSN